MALRTVLSQGGYSVGNGVFEANVILANGDITTSNITSTVAFIGSLTGNASGSAATVTTAAQPNITSTGSLTGLTVSNATGIVNFTTSANVTLGAVGNLHISGGTNGYVLSTDGSGALSWISAAVASGSNIVLDTFSGNGVQTVFTLTNAPTSENYTLININGVSQLHSAYTVANANVTLSTAPANGASIEVMTFNLGGGGGSGNTSNISNGTSNVSIATSGGNVTTSVAGNANIIVVTGTGVNVAGTLNTTGNTTFTGANVTLGAVGNLHISGGTNGYVLSTDGSGALSWISAAVASGSNIVVDTFSGNGVQTVFTLTNAPTSENYTLININGVSQLHSAYTVANANVTLSTAPANGASIEVMTFNLGGGSSGNTSNISNGTSNVSIATSGGNVTTSVAGNANIIIVTGTGVNVAGTLNTTGNLTAGNVSATTFTGALTGAATTAATVTTAAQPNITSVGTLTSLAVTGNITSGNANLGNLVTANFFTGNGYLLTGVGNATAIVNGNSNVNIPSANGNVNISAAGNANVIVVTGTGVNVAGTLNATGNLTAGNVSATTFTGALTGAATSATTAGTVTTAAQPNITSTGSLTGLTVSNATGIVNFTTSANVTLGAVANLHISGGTTGYVLSTDGSGALSWISAAVAASGSNIIVDTFSGNGVQTVFTLTNAPTSENYTLININGVSQLHSAYTVANANVTLSTAPVNGAAIEVMTFNLGSGSSGFTYVEVTNNTSANVNTKYIVNTNSANLTITLPSSPALGDEVGIIDGTGNASVHAITIGRNGGNIQGAASNMTVTTDRSAFTLVYYNVTQGWILTNV